MRLLRLWFSLAGLVLLSMLASAQANQQWRSWNQPVEPYRIIGNIYYVGASDITSFLIVTPAGHILLDGGFAETAPIIQSNVKNLGFRLEDIKVLLNSHAHSDHAGGLAEMKRLTGAKLMASEADAVLLRNGGKGDFAWGDAMAYAPVAVDRILQDRELVSLGNTTMTARLTPGHTKGCTTWTMEVTEDGKKRNVVFVCSTTAPGYTLVKNATYPAIEQDYVKTFQLLKSLPCDVFLAPHGSFFSMQAKAVRLRKGEKPNPFIDPDGYKEFLQKTETKFTAELERQRKDAASDQPGGGRR